MGRIHWGAPFSFAQKSLQKTEKNVIYPLTYTAVYAIIRVSGGRYKIKAPDRKR